MNFLFTNWKGGGIEGNKKNRPAPLTGEKREGAKVEALAKGGEGVRKVLQFSMHID